MMIAPEIFVEQYKDSKYEELLKVRDELILDIHAFETTEPSEDDKMIHPSPNARYQCNMEYLAKLLELIIEKYRDKIWGDA